VVALCAAAVVPLYPRIQPDKVLIDAVLTHISSESILIIYGAKRVKDVPLTTSKDVSVAVILAFKVEYIGRKGFVGRFKVTRIGVISKYAPPEYM
jgi:hypothetical protein